MKKFSFIMALILTVSVFTVLPGTNASAYSADTVAVIGSEEYSDLDSAATAAKSGDTIKIVADISTKAALTISGPGYVDGKMTIKKDITIDGDGHTIAYSGGTSDAAYAISAKDISLLIKNLTVTSAWSGIDVQDGSYVTLENVNVYAGGSKKGETTDLESTQKGTAVNVKETARGHVVIKSGEYKSYSGVCLQIRNGSISVYDGNFIAEKSEIVLQVGEKPAPDLQENSTALGWIYGGTFSKPVSSAQVNGCVIRSYNNGSLMIYGGSFYNYQFGNPKTATYGESVILGGTSGSKGNVYVLGGDFYLLSENPKSQILDNWGTDSENIFAYITGGNFYETIVEGRSDENIDGTSGVLRLSNDAYNITKTDNIMVTIDEEEIPRQLKKFEFSYKYSKENAPAGAKIQIDNPDGKTYYSDSLWEAVNCWAKEGATVKLLDNITVDAPVDAVSRYHTLTLDGNSKTVSASGNIPYILRLQTGDYTIKNISLDNSGANALTFGAELLDGQNKTYSLKVTFDDSSIKSSKSDGYAVAGLLSGEIVFSNTTVNGVPKTETLNISASDENDDQEGDTDTTSVDTGSQSEDSAEDTSKQATGSEKASDTSVSAGNSGCKSSIGIPAVCAALIAVAAAVICKRRIKYE